MQRRKHTRGGASFTSAVPVLWTNTQRSPCVVTLQVVQTQDLQGQRWEVNNFSNTVWEAAIWMHHFFQVDGGAPVCPPKIHKI